MATRRDFIKMGGLATAAGLTSGMAGKALARTPSGLFKLPEGIESSSIAFYSGKTFEPHLMTSFSVINKKMKGSVSLTLVEVKDSIHKSDWIFGKRTKSCSLVFEGPKGKKLRQDSYKVSHSEIRDFSALLVPITKEGNRYEIVFSRI